MLNEVCDGQDVIRDIHQDGSTVDYLNGLGVDEKLRQTSAAGVFYFTSDHLGSTTALTDAAGNVVERMTYDSFGNGGASTRTRYTFTGREYDADTGLYYYRARWYDSQAGRFISEDPIGFEGGINFYAYVSNNPNNRVDPFGLQEGRTWEIYNPQTYYSPSSSESEGCECPRKYPEYPFAWGAAFLEAFGYYSNQGYEPNPWSRQPGIPEPDFINHLSQRYGNPPSLLGGTISFIGFSSGPSIPTSRTQLEQGFRNAGFRSYPNTRTPEPGTNYVLPNGNICRVMQGSSKHPPRLMHHSSGPGNPPLMPNGSNIPPGLRGNAVRDLTHFPLEP